MRTSGWQRVFAERPTFFILLLLILLSRRPNALSLGTWLVSLVSCFGGWGGGLMLVMVLMLIVEIFTVHVWLELALVGLESVASAGFPSVEVPLTLVKLRVRVERTVCMLKKDGIVASLFRRIVSSFVVCSCERRFQLNRSSGTRI